MKGRCGLSPFGSLPQMWLPLLLGFSSLLPPGSLAQTDALQGAPPAVWVACEAHRMVVRVQRGLFGAGRLVAPSDLALGKAGPRCPPAAFDPVSDAVVFEARLHECGSAVQTTPEWLIYRTSLVYAPSLDAHPVIVRTLPAEIPIECRYPRKGNLSSRALRPTWAPFRSTASAEARLGFSLRLMTDDWRGERTSARVHLGEPLRLQADVQAANHRPLRVFVDSCVAVPSPGIAPSVRYAVVHSHGCLVDDGRPGAASSAFLSPRSRPETLRFTVDAFRFAGDPRNLIYLTCRLKAAPAERAPDPLNKACSFSAKADAWLPLEGSPEVCRCCQSQDCGRRTPSWGAWTHGSGPRLGMSGPRSRTVETEAGHARLVLGPLFVSDGRESVTNVPDDPTELVMEEGFLPVVEPKAAAVPGTRILGGASEEEGEVEPARPWGAYVRGLFLSGGGGGSGFGEETEAAVPEGSTALEFNAEVASRPLEDALPSGAPRRFPMQATNLAAKGPKRLPGGGAWLTWSFLAAGGAAAVLIFGSLWLLRRCRRSNPALDTAL